MTKGDPRCDGCDKRVPASGRNWLDAKGYGRVLLCPQCMREKVQVTNLKITKVAEHHH
jgi:hypothetical protein